jgi:hypothetical protein
VSETRQESFEEFRKSLAHGSRTDLNFKFLATLSDEEAGRFLQELFGKLADTFDDGDLERLIAHVREGQRSVYSRPSSWQYEDGPFTPLDKPVRESKLLLLTSSGHFVAGDDPQPLGVKNMTQQEATSRINEFLRIEPQLSALPVDVAPDRLRVRHPGYDVRPARADPNVNLPLKPLHSLHQQGVIGQLHPLAYSFVGACAQTPLVKVIAPDWAEQFCQQHIGAALLVPV